MKKILPTIIILFMVSALNAQDCLEKYSASLVSNSENIPEDQIFIHTDRNLYFPGDTIYFQSYIQDRELQIIQTASKSNYVLLQNEGNEVIDSARFKVNSSMAPGYLTLPDTVRRGNFKILSYTSLMQNYDPKYCYTSWIRVDELNANAVNAAFSFDKKSYSPNDTAEIQIQLMDQSGDALKNEAFSYSLVIKGDPTDYYKSQSNYKGEATITLPVPDSISDDEISIEIALQNRKYSTRKRIPKTVEKINLRFLPEGGTFIYGVRQKIAFNAVDHDGTQLYISGVVRNSHGEFIDSIKSRELGPGRIEFTPIKGETYFAEIQGYPDTIFDLPLPSDGLPVLRIEHFENSVVVRVSSPAAASRNDILVFRKNNKVLVSKEIDSTYQAFKFDTKNLPQGTAGFLLLDEHLNPVAERMVYLNAFKQVNMNISPAKKVYQPGEETEISFSLSDSLNSNPPALFSVAVVDSVTGFYPNLLTANIEESFLFDEQFYNNLPGHIKFRGLSGMNQEELDILMMTYGWKRFSKEKSSGESLSSKNREAERIYYDLLKLIIDDNFTNRQTKKMSEIENPFFLMSVEDSRIFDLSRIDHKSYYFLFDSLGRGVNNIMITTADSALRYVSSGSIDFPVNQDYFHDVSSQTLAPILQTNDAFSIISDYQIISNRTRFIEEVSVTESRTKAPEYVNEYEKEYKNFSTHTLDKGDIEAAFDLLTLIRMLHPIKIIFDPWEPNIFTVYLRRVFYGLGNPVLEPALFVLDGFPVGTDNRKIYFLRPEEIHSVTALKGPYGYYRYGPKAIGGVIFIETKHNSIGGEYAYEEPLPDRGDLGKVLNLFRPNIEFYVPHKKDISDDPQHWTRPTLYWNPELIFDGSSPVSLTFPNHLKKGTVLIRVNGVTEDSRPFFGEYRYKIK